MPTESDVIAELKSQISILNDRQLLMMRRLDELRNRYTISLADAKVLTKTCSGLEMFIDSRDTGSGLDIVRLGYIEPDVMKVMQRSFARGGIFLDVGSNFGFYSLFAADQLGPEGRVIAFEANPHLLPFIKGSAYINGMSERIRVVNKAVSDTAGTARFGFSFEGIGGGSLAKGAGNSATEGQYIDVPLTRVDDEIPDDCVVSVIKLDVEGAEAAALRGMRSTIARSPDVHLILEFFPGLHQPGSGPSEILDILDSYGLKVWRIGNRGRLHESTRDELIQGGDCYLLAARDCPDDREMRLTQNSMRMVGARSGDDGQLRGEAGTVLIHGPYWYLPEGNYEVTIGGEIHGEIRAAVTHEFGFEIASSILNSDNNKFSFGIPNGVRYFEVVLRSQDIHSSIAFDYAVIKDIS